MKTSETAQKILQILETKLSASVELTDESWKHAGHGAKGGHYSVRIQSSLFINKSPLERQRMVYAALGPLMEEEVHALSMKCETP